MTSDTVGGRIRLTRENLSQAEFSSRLDVHEQTLGKYERNKRLPDAEFLTRLRDQFGVSIDWLLTGRGTMRPGETEPMAVAPAVQETPGNSEAVDEELMALLVDGIMAVYKDVNVGLPPRDLGRLAERMRGDLVESYTDPDERRVAVKGMLRQLRRSLQEAPVDAGSKRRV